MRTLAGLAGVALLMLGCSDAGGDADRSFEEIPGVESRLLNDLVGAAGTPVILVSRLGGGELYRIDGDELTKLAEVPENFTYIHSFVRGADGNLYLCSSHNNEAGEDAFVYRLDGGSWTRVAQAPGVAEIAVDSRGTIYAAVAVIGARGGLWRALP